MAALKLKLFFNHEFYWRLPGLSDVYNNGKTVPGKKLFASYELAFELARRLRDCQNNMNHEDVLGRPPCVKK